MIDQEKEPVEHGVDYERLVLNQGWSPDAFERWLGPAIAQLVLAAR